MQRRGGTAQGAGGPDGFEEFDGDADAWQLGWTTGADSKRLYRIWRGRTM